MVFIQLLRPTVMHFLKRQSGTSLYEYALVASLFAVVSLIIAVAFAAID